MNRQLPSGELLLGRRIGGTRLGSSMIGQVGHRVLLVASNPLRGRSLAVTLVAAGYVVRRAVDGLDAIGKLRGGPPDLIISDLALPRMSGSEFLGVVRRRFPQIPVIAISDEAPPQGMQEELMADAYFQGHDFSPTELLKSMSDLIGNAPPRPPFPEVERLSLPGDGPGEGHYFMACPECLRAIDVPRGPELAQGEYTTACTHCRNIVRFLIDDEDSSEPRPRAALR